MGHSRCETESIERLRIGEIDHEETELHVIRPGIVAQSVISWGERVTSTVEDALLQQVDIFQLGPEGESWCECECVNSIITLW